MNRGSEEKVVSFRSRSSQAFQSNPPNQPTPSRPPLPPHVRRRRWIWLITMLIIILWSGSQLFVQAREVHSKEMDLLKEKKHLEQLQQENRALEQEVDRLHDEAYLFELARKLGYKKPREEILDLPDMR